jgi:hypothetical protein
LQAIESVAPHSDSPAEAAQLKQVFCRAEIRILAVY